MPRRRRDQGSLEPYLSPSELKLRSDIVQMKEEMNELAQDLAALRAAVLVERPEKMASPTSARSRPGDQHPSARTLIVDPCLDQTDSETMKRSIKEIQQFLHNIDIPYLQKEMRFLYEKLLLGLNMHREELSRIAEKQMQHDQLLHTFGATNAEGSEKQLGNVADSVTSQELQNQQRMETTLLATDQVRPPLPEEVPGSASGAEIHEREIYRLDALHSLAEDAREALSTFEDKLSVPWPDARVGSSGEQHGRSARSSDSSAIDLEEKPPLHCVSSDRAALEETGGQQVYTFAESVWDCSLFVGTAPMGHAGTIAMGFLFLINVTAQLIYMIIVYEEFTGTDYGPEVLSGFERFRYEIAHDAKYLDGGSKSLAARICAFDSSVEMAGQQVSAVKEINSFIPQHEDHTFGKHQGPVLCFISIFVWSLTVFLELRGLFSRSVSWRCLRAKGRAFKGRFVSVDDEIVVEGISSLRFAFGVVVSLMQLTIAISLWVSGLMYLGKTTDLEELVLNAMALNCVLELDEMLFAALAPFPTQAFIRSIRPISCPVLGYWKGADAPSACSVLGIVAATVLSVPVLISPEVERLKAARSALCAGNKDFVAKEGNYPPFIFWADSQPMVSNTDAGLSYRPRLVRDVVRGNVESIRDIKLVSINGAIWSLNTLTGYNVAEASARFNTDCRDMPLYPLPPSIEKMHLKNLELNSGVRTETLCSREMLSSSSGGLNPCQRADASGWVVRMMCPVLCGCDTPFSDLLLPDPDSGCPSTCMYTDKAQAAFRDTSCSESPPHEIVKSTLWQQMAADIGKIGSESKWPALISQQLTTLSQLMLSQGCRAVTTHLQTTYVDLCVEGTSKGLPLKSFRMVCPETCGCQNRTGNDRVMCPYKCFIRADPMDARLVQIEQRLSEIDSELQQ